MKISLKINYNQLEVLLEIVQSNNFSLEHETIEHKANNFLLLDVLKKIVNSRFTKMGIQKNKVFSIPLKYQEAAILWNNLNNANILDSYKRNISVSISNQLHQKLIS